jgi:two-component system response regulator DevR
VTYRQIRVLVPHIRILMLANDASQHTATASIHSGAQGYAPNKSASEIVPMMKTLASGETYMNPAIAYSVLQSGSFLSVSSVHKLSWQQESIMQLLAQGKTNKEMAHQLNVSENTVKNYLAIIFHKLKVHTRKEALARFLGI